MAGRYLITGVQIGCLMALDKEGREKLLAEIEDRQFIGTSDKSISDDVATVAMEWGDR